MFSCCACKSKKTKSSNGDSSEESADGSEEVDSIKIELPLDNKNSNSNSNSNLNEQSSNIVNENIEQLNGNHVSNNDNELEEEEEESIDVIYEVIKPKVRPVSDEKPKPEADKESSGVNEATDAPVTDDNHKAELEPDDIDVNSEEFMNEVKEISREIIRDVEERSLIIVNEAHRVLVNTRDIDDNLEQGVENNSVDNEINLIDKKDIDIDVDVIDKDYLGDKVIDIKDDLVEVIKDVAVELSSEVEENQSDISNHEDNSITTVKEIEVNLTDIINEDNILEVKSISKEGGDYKFKSNEESAGIHFNETTNAKESFPVADSNDNDNGRVVDKVSIHTPEIIDHVRKISNELINEVEVEVIDEVKKISSEIIDQVEENITDMITVVEENLMEISKEIEENLSKIRKHSKDKPIEDISGLSLIKSEEEYLDFSLIKSDQVESSGLPSTESEEVEKLDFSLMTSEAEDSGPSIKSQEEKLDFSLMKSEQVESSIEISNDMRVDPVEDARQEGDGEEGEGKEEGNEEEDNDESDSTSTTVSIKTIDDIKTCKLTLDNIVMGPPAVCLYQAPGYIERTIADGPDDEGDDSVFENSITTEPGYENDREEHLEQLVTRLEKVTKRLENVPSKFFTETQEVAIQTHISLPKRVESVDVSTGQEFDEEQDQEFPDPPDFGDVEAELEVVDQESLDYTLNIMSVSGFEDLVAGPFAEYLAISQKIGGDVAAHSKLVDEAFRIQKEFIKTAASRPAPSSQPEQVSLLGPTSSQIQLIQQFRENNRGSQYFNHLSAISESIPALGWVAVTPTPAPYVKEMNDAGQFYTNRVLKDWKEKDKNHVEWCKAWVQTLSELQKYIRQHHTTGLVWSKTGSVSAPVPPPPGGMPPPPPCMPVGDISASAGGDDRSALFAQINQGENITKSLKKVTSEMQTHKNSSLRTGPAPFKAPVVNNSGSPMKSVPPANAPIDKPPVFSRDGKKWLIEYHKGNKDLVIENPEMNNVVYMYRCQDSTLIIKGKLNSIVMDSCRKSSIVFDSLVSSIEFVNCQSVQMQVLGKVPTISIDKTDGCQMYLNQESLNVELITSKSSEMNVMVPKGNGDYTEYPVPEQFKTTINSKGLSTIAVDSLG
ncbi:uncharacterized protein LOC130672433 isoform X2 [Microplitis mediator]|uniref:uncharacterized protein LOC130672433 isoform X2 n=1 Tax=Microplitis mediator TaxID=375433 RepID=UPI002552AF68|nr:uncharacterized protein LOC130672433 isoform X2 [Microplitis mediator]